MCGCNADCVASYCSIAFTTQRAIQECWVPDRRFDDVGATGCDNHTCFFLATISSPESPQTLISLSKEALSAEDGGEGKGHGFALLRRPPPPPPAPRAVSACASPLARAHKGGASLADTASPSALKETH